MDKNGFFRPQRFIFPDEIDQVLRRVDELGGFVRKLGIELGSLGIGEHAGVDANAGVLGSVDKPLDPVLGAVCVTGLDGMPI